MNNLTNREKALWLSNIVLLLLIIIGILNYIDPNPNTPPTPVPPIPNCCPGNCYDAVCDLTPKFSLELATEMVKNYRENHWKSINSSCPPFNAYNRASSNDPNAMVDARSAWFSFTTLKKFINTVETNSCFGSACPNKLELGVRIYYAEYPNNPGLLSANGISSTLIGMHTLIMVPTYEDGTKEIDFDPTQIDKEHCAASSVFDTSAGTIYALSPEVSAQNHGGLAPPPFDCGTCWDATGAAFMKYVDMKSTSYSTTNCPPTGH